MNTLALAAQRFALPAGGRDERTPLCRNQFQATQLFENAATPTRRVHAVLGTMLKIKLLILLFPR
jgi:hypothetical protein